MHAERQRSHLRFGPAWQAKPSMITLGINSVYHETAAALLVDGRVVAAAEEERFNRRKHGKAALVDNPHELPAAALRYCLDTAGIAADRIDAVGYSFDPALRAAAFVYDRQSQPGGWGDEAGEGLFRACLDRVPAAVSDLLGDDLGDRFHWVPHHLAHAASSYYPSGAGDAAIFVADGIGEFAANLLASGEDGMIRPLQEIPYPHSIGFLWEKLSRFLGFSEYDACKVMGLAGYGDAAHTAAAFRRLVRIEEGGFAIDPAVLEFRRDCFGPLEELLGPRRERGQQVTSQHAHIAAGLQECTNAVMMGMVRRLYELRPAKQLCLAGGVALNCTCNWRIKEEGPFAEVFIPPAAHDAGTAIGAALYLQRNGPRAAAPMPCHSAYLGPEYDDAAIERAIHDHGLAATRDAAAPRRAASLVAAGKIVGWFQGRMEFGPRALGNRSLLADPRRHDSRTRMNRSVKRREGFRPFAPSVLAEPCAEWFHLGRSSPGYRYMLFACPVRAEKAPLIPAVLHADGTSRIQIVEREHNPRFHALIESFAELTGVPMVLNTSFNDREPIVCTPADAVRTFLSTDIDALFLGDYLVESRNGRSPGQ